MADNAPPLCSTSQLGLCKAATNMASPPTMNYPGFNVPAMQKITGLVTFLDWKVMSKSSFHLNKILRFWEWLLTEIIYKFVVSFRFAVDTFFCLSLSTNYIWDHELWYSSSFFIHQRKLSRLEGKLITGIVQDYAVSIANVLEILQSHTNHENVLLQLSVTSWQFVIDFDLKNNNFSWLLLVLAAKPSDCFHVFQGLFSMICLTLPRCLPVD